MCELNIIYRDSFWYFLNEDGQIDEMNSLPMRAKLLHNFNHDIEEVYQLKKKNDSLKIIFQKDKEDLWILHTYSD
tara:strand:- start:116 stop:340 length:225 start_codon:yes stop_codon:yes gene_type:complete